MKTLNEIFVGYGTDKDRHGYGNVYEPYLSPLRDKKINFFEIGVSLWGGASIKAFREYFTEANVIAMDISPLTPSKDYDFFHGDQASARDLDKVIAKYPTFDVIIDDGSHFQYDMTFSFSHLFPFLVSGGVYIIEDICTKDNLERGDLWWGREGKDMACAVEVVFDNYKESGKWESPYLSDTENEYITSNIEKVDYQPSLMGCSIAVIVKK